MENKIYWPDGNEAVKYPYDDDLNLCGSCGCVKANGPLIPRRYIQIGVGKLNEPSDDGSTRIDVIETQNGPITVGIRYVW